MKILKFESQQLLVIGWIHVISSAYVLLYNLHVGYRMRDDVRKVRGTDERKGPREVQAL